jgi:hypothetical protein
MSEKTEVAKCEVCGCEYAAKTDCPTCANLEQQAVEKIEQAEGLMAGLCGYNTHGRSILDLVTDPSGRYVRELDQARCSTCLRRLSCQLVSQARKAKPGMLIAGIVIEGRDLRCRQYKYAGGNRRPATRRAAQHETPKLL